MPLEDAFSVVKFALLAIKRANFIPVEEVHGIDAFSDRVPVRAGISVNCRAH